MKNINDLSQVNDWVDVPDSGNTSQTPQANDWVDLPEKDNPILGFNRGIGGLQQSAGGLLQAGQESEIPLAREFLESASEKKSFPLYKTIGMLGSAALNYLMPGKSKELREEGKKRVAENMPSETSLAGQVAEYVPATLGYLGAGIAGGAPALAALAGSEAFGGKYGEKRDEGKSREEALERALPSGALGAVTGVIPYEAALSPVAKGLLSRAAAGAVGANVGNAAQVAGEFGLDKQYDRPNMTWDEFTKEFGNAVSSTALPLGIIGGVGGAAAHGILRKGEKRQADALRAEEEAMAAQQKDQAVSQLMQQNIARDPGLDIGSAYDLALRQFDEQKTAPRVEDETSLLGEIERPASGETTTRPQDGTLLLENKANNTDNLQIARQDREQALGRLLEAAQGKERISEDNNIDKVTADDQNLLDALQEFRAKDMLVDDLKGGVPKEEQAISAGDLRNADIDNVGRTLDAVAKNDLKGIELPVLADLFDTGHIKINENGRPSLSPLGEKLAQEVSSRATSEKTQSLTPEQAISPDVKPEVVERTPDQVVNEFKIEKSLVDNYLNNESINRLYQQRILDDADLYRMASLERSSGFKAVDAYIKSKVKGQDVSPILEKFGYKEPKDIEVTRNIPRDSLPQDGGRAFERTFQRKREEISPNLIEGVTPEILLKDARSRLATLEEKSGRPNDYNNLEQDLRLTNIKDNFKDPEKGIRDVANYLGDSKAVQDLTGVQYSITPTDKFIANKDRIKEDVISIAKKINPTLDIRLMDKIFGEGEGLLQSGAKTVDKQEVAGYYDRLNNIMAVSMDHNKFDPRDTAYHEAYHSIREMLTPEDVAVLEGHFKGDGNISPLEQEAIQFANVLNKRNAPGLTPAVRRVLNKIAQFFRDLGRKLKLGEFRTVDDIFNRVEKGDVYQSYAEELKKAVSEADIDGLARMINDQNIPSVHLERAIKEVSPALHEVAYGKKTTPVQTQEILDSMADQGEDYAQAALEHRVTNDKVPYDQKKVDEAIENYLQYSMGPAESKRYLKRAYDSVADSIDRITDNPVGDAWRLAFLSSVSQMRRISERAIDPKTGKRTTSKAAQALTDIFSKDPGSGRATKPTYDQQIADFSYPIITRIDDSLRGFTDKEKGEVVRLMQNPEMKFSRSSKIGQAAISLAKINKEILEFARGHGLDVNEVKGYFPRDYLQDKIIADPKGFMEDAAKAFRQTAVDAATEEGRPFFDTNQTEAEFKEYAEQWYNRILDEKSGISQQDNLFQIEPKQVPTPPSLKNRPLSKSADEIMRKWLNQDPMEVMVNHVQRVARKSVFNNEFGTNQIRVNELKNRLSAGEDTPELRAEIERESTSKYKRYEQAMRDEGITPENMQEMRKLVSINTGLLWRNLTQTERDIRGFAMLAQTLKFLPLAAKNAVQEAFTIGVRSGSVKEAIKGFGRSNAIYLKSLAPEMTKRMLPDLETATDGARKLGIVNDIVEQIMMDSRMDVTRADKYSRAMHKFFDVTQIGPMTAATKIASYMAGNDLLAKYATDIIEGNKYQKSAEYDLRNLIGSDDTKGFAKWFLENNDKITKTLDDNVLFGNTPQADQYRHAMRNIVEETIQTPTKAMKTPWASHPWGSFIYSLMSFAYAFEHNVLRSNFQKTKAAIFNEDNNGNFLKLTPQDRARMMYPMALTMGMMSAVSYGFNELWDTIYNNKEKRKENSPVKAAVQTAVGAGLTGKYASLINTGMYFRNAGDLQKLGLGNYPSSVAKLFGTGLEAAKFQGKSNTAKRNFTKEVLSTVILPTSNYLAISYLPTPVAFAALQVTNSPQFKNLVVDSVAGKRRNPRN